MLNERTAPTDILDRLHEIDPTADLVYLGEGVWLLGRLRPSDEVARTARRSIALEKEAPVSRQRARKIAVLRKVAREGFRISTAYEQNDPDDRIIQDFRLRMFNLRNRQKEAFEEALEASDIHAGITTRQDIVADLIQSEGRGLIRHARGSSPRYFH